MKWALVFGVAILVVALAAAVTARAMGWEPVTKPDRCGAGTHLVKESHTNGKQIWDENVCEAN